MFKMKVPEMGEFYKKLGEIAENSQVNFVITVSEDQANFPEELKKYI